ncbi:hypothetical protein GCM10022224_086930 [Nonomuraea antimicrobica]|uniref:Uncharacterized protein n=1 Tax=Nonomuraea antimicrobica TaxID=561173 RepID=A0ABP7DNC8_9ACTN
MLLPDTFKVRAKARPGTSGACPIYGPPVAPGIPTYAGPSALRWSGLEVEGLVGDAV